MQIDMEKSLFSLFQIAGFLGVIYELIAMFFVRDKISAIFTNLTEIYEASKYRSGLD